MKFTDHLKGAVKLAGNKVEEYTYSEKMSKDYSELLDYLRKKPCAWTGRRIRADRDIGNVHVIEIVNAAEEFESRFTVTHSGNCAMQLEVRMLCIAPEYNTKNIFDHIQKNIKDCEMSQPAFQQAQVAPVQPAVDYSAYSMMQLLETLERKVNVFGQNPTMATLNDLTSVKKAFAERVGALPLAERGKFAGPLGNIDMYLNTLNTQLGDPMMVNVIGQFLGTYIAQMQGSISQMAALLAGSDYDAPGNHIPVQPEAIVQPQAVNVVPPIAPAPQPQVVNVVPPVAPAPQPSPIAYAPETYVNSSSPQATPVIQPVVEPARSAPQYNQESYAATSATVPQSRRATNMLAILGIIFAFIMPIAGLICSIIGFATAANYGGKGKKLALVGIILNVLMVALLVTLMIILLT